jgi:beta-galactosidase
MWGIGNEIFEAGDTSGHRIAKQLAEAVRSLDSTRAITEAMIYMPQSIKHIWEDYQPHLANLNVDGYNYFIGGKLDPMQRDSATNHRYETQHERFPHKLYMSTEYYPSAALENWTVTEKYPFVIGGFSWTAMDYIGEANIGGPAVVPEATRVPQGLMSLMFFFKPESWPVFNANSGDLDLIGNRKAASYYQNVVWRNSPVELLVQRPIPEGKKELRSPWGFPGQEKSWTWPGQEGKKMQVVVYTRGNLVKLQLNGKTIAEQTVPEGSITVTFEIDYQPGTLTATVFDGGKETGTSSLSTTGKPAAIRLVADRTTIKANGNDLSYVRAEVIDEKGNVVPYVDELEINYELNGQATLAGVGNGNPADLSSFQQPKKKVYHGRGLAIVRSTEKSGTVTLSATAKGLKPAKILLATQ